MNGLVMSDAISQEVNALNAIVDVGVARITCCGVVRKGVREDRDPQRRQVRAGAEEPPQPECELRYDLARCLWLAAAPCRSVARRANVVQRSLTMLAREQRGTLVPRSWPLRLLPVRGQCLIEGVSEHDLDAADVFVERAAHQGVLLVQLERLVEVAT